MRSQHSWTNWLGALVSFIAMVATAQSLSAQDAATPLNSQSTTQTTGLYQDIEQFGGPSSVSGQLAEDNNVNVPEFRWQRLQQYFEPWFEFKQRLDDSCGLQLSIDESISNTFATAIWCSRSAKLTSPILSMFMHC